MFFFFKQKTAYEMRISDWSSDVCSSDLGGITIANAPGTGIADDKALYSYMPDIIEFYTGEKALLPNVPTWRCSEPEHLREVLDRLPELVVKEVHGSGGYGMLVGPADRKSTRLNSSH